MQYILYCMLTTVLDALHLVLYVIVNIRWFSLKRNKSEINSFFISWSVIIQCKNKHCIIIDSLWDYGIMGLWDYGIDLYIFPISSLGLCGWVVEGWWGVKVLRRGLTSFLYMHIKEFFWKLLQNQYFHSSLHKTIYLFRALDPLLILRRT